MFYLLFSSLFLLTLCQQNFNYIQNGNFTQHNCTVNQLTDYKCTIPVQHIFSWRTTLQSYLYLQNENDFQTTMKNIVVAPLDVKFSSDKYTNIGIGQIVSPLFYGSYKLSFTIMTRKVGLPSNYMLNLLVKDQNVVWLFKSYYFSELGTMNITQTIQITNDLDKFPLPILVIFLGDGQTHNVSYAVGVTNVKFQKIFCNSNEISITLVTGQKYCSLSHIIQSIPNCRQWIYYHVHSTSVQILAGKISLVKHISCNICDVDSKQVLVLINDLKKLKFGYILFGCTINQLPNTGMYYKTDIKNQKRYFYYTNTLDGCQLPFTATYNLIVPSIQSQFYDQFGVACGVNPVTGVKYWEVVNGTYLPAKCTQPGIWPIIVNDNSRECKKAQNIIPGCVVYFSNFSCYSCLWNYTRILLIYNEKQAKVTCLVESQTIDHCDSYRQIQNVYTCISCKTNYVLITLDKTRNICVTKNFEIEFCSNYEIKYEISSNNTYNCLQCIQGYNLWIGMNQLNKCIQIHIFDQNCVSYANYDNFQQCIECKEGFTLSTILTKGSSLEKCLKNRIEAKSGCQFYRDYKDRYYCTKCRGQKYREQLFMVTQHGLCPFKKCVKCRKIYQ